MLIDIRPVYDNVNDFKIKQTIDKQGIDKMKILTIFPEDWECSLENCPPGMFLLVKDKTLHVKTEYTDNNGIIESYTCSSGEAFLGGVKADIDRSQIRVIPVEYEWRTNNG